MVEGLEIRVLGFDGVKLLWPFSREEKDGKVNVSWSRVQFCGVAIQGSGLGGWGFRL